MNSTSTIKCSKCGKSTSKPFVTWLFDGSSQSTCLACWAVTPISEHRPALDLNQVVTLPEATELVNRSSNSVWKQLQTGLINARFCTIAGKKRGIWIIEKQSLIDHYAKLGEADEN